MSNSMNQKVAIVTGGSGGIGSEISKQLAATGVAVILTYFNNQDAANAVVQDIKNSGHEASSFRMNISQPEDVDALFKFVLDKYTKIDIMVNNAGTIIPRQIADVTNEMYHNVFGVNTFGSFLMMRASVLHMQNGGRILNTSSTMVNSPIAGGALYAASKAAMEVMGKALSKELGDRGITVNSMRVGATVPGMFMKAPPERQAALAQASPFKRLGTPSDIAKVVSFLVSEDSAWITGETLAIDGGIS